MPRAKPSQIAKKYTKNRSRQAVQAMKSAYPRDRARIVKESTEGRSEWQRAIPHTRCEREQKVSKMK